MAPVVDKSQASKHPVGFVGLGNMGRLMAANLAAAGFPLVVRDSDPAAERRFTDAHGGTVAGEPAGFKAVSVVVTMLPDGSAVREAALGWDGGIASALRPGSVILDMSSAEPVGTQKLAADLAPLGVRVVDAPVSGGIARAETGTLSLMVGGLDEEAFTLVLPVLETLGERIFRTGPLGSGHAMKALNNYCGAAAYAVTAEALAIGQQFGLSGEVMIDVINNSTGRSFNSEVVFKGDVLTGRYGTNFALALLAKDVGIAASLAEASELDTPVVALVSRRWTQALDALGQGRDHSEAHKGWWDVALAADGES